VSPFVLLGGGVVGLLLVILIYITSRVVATVVGKEAVGWIPHISRGLVSRAAGCLPEEHRDRYEEEWCRHIADCEDRPLTALAKAIGYAGSVRRLRRELAPDPVPSREHTRSQHVHIYLRLGVASQRSARRSWYLVPLRFEALSETARRASGRAVTAPLQVVSYVLRFPEALVRVLADTFSRLVLALPFPALNLRQTRTVYLLSNVSLLLGLLLLLVWLARSFFL
jgi:hypothetical protein